MLRPLSSVPHKISKLLMDKELLHPSTQFVEVLLLHNRSRTCRKICNTSRLCIINRHNSKCNTNKCNSKDQPTPCHPSNSSKHGLVSLRLPTAKLWQLKQLKCSSQRCIAGTVSLLKMARTVSTLRTVMVVKILKV